MEKRLKEYMSYVASIDTNRMSAAEREAFLKEMLIQIRFFQHERLIHLIVTVTFALLLMLAVLGSVFSCSISFILLDVFIGILLVPYIRHYYILENGVQQLYKEYDRIGAVKKLP